MRTIFIINRDSRAKYYGIGTYTRQLVNVVKAMRFNLTIVSLYAKGKNEVLVYEKENVRYIEVPSLISVVGDPRLYSKEDMRYQRNVYYLLLSYIPRQEEVYFHFNFMESGLLASLLKKNLKCKVVLAVHYTYWSFELLGNVDRLKKILLSQNRNEEEEKLFQYYVHEEDFLNNVADFVIAIAEHSYRTLCDLYKVPSLKIALINNGLVDGFYELDTNDKKI
ncbi:MAG: glycosyltransferase [Parabacteroides sp.]|nr:glycosyltransferase [Parabacteroides sp.]